MLSKQAVSSTVRHWMGQAQLSRCVTIGKSLSASTVCIHVALANPKLDPRHAALLGCG